jgi:hypothetical protein
MARLFSIYSVLIALLFCACEKSSGDHSTVLRMTVRSLNQGHQTARARRHVPIIVEFTNSGETVSGRLRVFRTARKKSALSRNNLFHERLISVPKGRRLETVHYFLQDQDLRDEICVLFEPASSRLDLPAKPQYPRLNIIKSGLSLLTLSDRDDPRILFTKIDLPSPESLQQVHCSTGDLKYLPSNSLSYSPYDVIVINDCDLGGFTKIHRQALGAWVEKGGWLLVSPGLQSGQLQRSGLGQLLPIEISEGGKTSDRSLASLSQFAGSRSRPGVSVLHHLKARPGARVLSETSQGLPLIITERRGSGRVTVLSFPLMSPAIRRWSRSSDFLYKLLPGLKTPPSASDGAPPLDEYLLNASSALAPLKPPSIAWVGPLLLLYALLVAPLSFTIARRRRSPGLFFAIALGIISATILAMTSLTWMSKGKGSVSTHVSLVELSEDSSNSSSRSQIKSLIGLFLSQARVLDMKPSPDSVATPITRQSVKQAGRVIESDEETTDLRQIKASTWSFRRFQESRLAVTGSLESELEIDQDYIVGEVHNRGTRDVEQALLFVKGQVAALGTIKAGQTASVRAPLFRALLDNERTIKPFLDRLLARVPVYHAYYPEASYEQVPGRERVFAAFQRRALMLKSPTGELPTLLVGFWREDPCKFQTSISETVALQQTIVVLPVFLPCKSGRLKLIECPGMVANRSDLAIERAFQPIYTLQSTAFATSESDPRGKVRFVFEIPVPSNQQFQPTKLIFEVRLQGDSTTDLDPKKIVIKVYDFVKGRYSKALHHDGKSLRFQSSDPKRFFNQRTGRAYLDIQNDTIGSIEVKGVHLRIAGNYKK